jgi:hypothetical protein
MIAAAGALGAGWLSTWFLAGTLEDLLALGLAAAVAYVSVVRARRRPVCIAGSPDRTYKPHC